MMQVGFGVTALCKGLAGGSQDGISHYTQELITQFAKRAELNLRPFSFAVGAQDAKELDRKVFETATPPDNTCSTTFRVASWKVSYRCTVLSIHGSRLSWHQPAG
jgi:hypothetical protein